MRQFMKPERIRIIAVLAIFNYIFLGSEYLFDNMIRYATDSAGVVRAQNYVLGISVIGFLLFPCINRYFNQKMREIGLYLLPIAGIICIFVIQEHLSYRSMLLSGFLLYILYGMIGSAVHYYAVVSLSTEKGLAQTVGFGYAFGLLLQFISNNLIHNSTVESVALSVFLAAMVLLVRRLSLECSRGVVGAEDSGSDSDTDIRKNNRRSLRHPMLAALLLISIVVLMTCIFSSLDNAVTLVHAGGSVDIGQWPRLLLAVSGLLAGVLFDIKEHRFMQIMMYCVTLLSTMCVVIIVWGGPFMAGLIVFYLSAGFFVVYFTTSFMDLSYYMKVSIVFRKLNELLKEDGIGIYDTDLNNYCTSQEMGGFSITLMKLDDELRKYYDMPCYCPFYAKGAVEPVREVADEIEDTAPKKEKKEKKQRIASTYVRGKHYEKLNAEDCRQMLLYIADKILANEPYLTEVDSAIGDGDHGIGMATGMKNVKEVLLDMEGEKNVYSIFEEAGKAMLLSMGGASGVIFGSLYLEGALGTESKDYLTAEDLKAMEEKSLKAIQERGKASVGDKTMVDALAPAVEAMQQHYTEGLEKMLEEAEAGALRGVENTKDCIARFGRAKSLGERALGFQDAGATSTWLIFQSMREFVKGE